MKETKADERKYGQRVGLSMTYYHYIISKWNK